MPHILTLIVFLPVAAMVVMACVPSTAGPRLFRTLSFAASGLVLALSMVLLTDFLGLPAEARASCIGVTDGGGVLFEERVPWIPAFGIYYHLGVDGLSVAMVVLTALLGFLALFSTASITRAPKGFHMLYMLLLTGILGVFVALDFFLFYVFWEIMLLPMYFLIGLWGGPRKEYAAIKFFLYTLAGSVLMLIAIIVLYMKYGTFSIVELADIQPFKGQLTTAMLLWGGFFIAFAVKVPMFPFHTWLPDAHVEAPTAISVILAGVLLKLGGYGILRINFPLFPEATASLVGLLAVFGIINIIYGALCAMAQTDLKSLVAYSSISHMGYMLLGMASLNALGMNGAIFQMFNHGLTSAMLFMLVGVIYDRAHHRDLRRLGGLGVHMPRYLAMATVGFFASLGLPGFSSFISEVMIFLGAFTSDSTNLAPQLLGADFRMPVLAAIGTFGLVLGAAYTLYAIQQAFLGPPRDEYANFPDLKPAEAFPLAVLGVLCVLFGILPSLAIGVFDGMAGKLLTLWPAGGVMAGL